MLSWNLGKISKWILAGLFISLPFLFQNCSGHGGSVIGNPLRTPLRNIQLKYLAYNGSPAGALTPVTRLDFCTKYVDLRYDVDPGDGADAIRIPGGDGSAVLRFNIGREIQVDPNGEFIADLKAPEGRVGKITFINLPPSHPENAGSDCSFEGNLRLNQAYITSKFHEIAFVGSYEILENSLFGFSLQELVDQLLNINSDEDLDQAVVDGGYYSPWWEVTSALNVVPLDLNGNFGGLGAFVSNENGILQLQAVANRDQVPADSLLGYWNMDEPSDYSSLLTGNTLGAWTAGQMGSAFRIENESRYLNLGNGPQYDNLESIGVSVWVRPISMGDSSCGSIISKKTSASKYGWRFGFVSGDNGNIEFVRSYENNKVRAAFEQEIPMGEWSHLAFSYAGGILGSEIKIYLNGEEIKDEAHYEDAAGASDDDSEALLLIGADRSKGEPTCYFHGDIDELGLWERAIDKEEVQGIYSRQKGQYHPIGLYESPVKDSFADDFRWGQFAPVPQRPYGKELVSQNQDETVVYAEGGLNTNGLVGLWHFNGDVKDSSGNGRHGSADNTQYLSGSFKSALSFDGTSDEVSVPAEEFEFDPAEDYTWSFWVQPEEFSQNTRVWSMSANGNFGLSLVVHNRPAQNYVRMIRFAIEMGLQGSLIQRSQNAVVHASKWNHIVVKYAGGEAPESRVKIYVNGVDQTDPTRFSYSGSLSVLNPSTFYFGRGHSDANPDHRFGGRLDEVSFWARSLSVQEIGYLYQRGLHRVYYQVRSCNDPLCEGELFVGPDGSSSSYFSESLNSFASLPLFLLSDVLIPNRYFQYRVYMESLDYDSTPRLISVDLNTD